MNARAPSPLRVAPGRFWRIARLATQAVVWAALLATPLVGVWQRTDAASLSAWRAPDSWDLGPVAPPALGNASTGEQLWEWLPLRGGATGMDLLGVPFEDPVAGGMGLLRATPSPRAALALALPLLLALLAGRVYCGWLCPFGGLSRLLSRALLLLPRPPRRYSLAGSRWVRWAVLAACLVTGALGSQVVVTLALPHLLVADSIMSFWLLGGGGAVLGWLLGLVAVGVFLGPTTFCASVCPTGAVLSLFGRLRAVRLRIEDPPTCGTACRRCDLACWLQLTPASGDAGPDCDNCLRCASACPHDNLRVGAGRGRMKKPLPIVVASTLLLVAGGARAGSADPYVKPALTLDAHQEHEGVNIAVGVLDESRVRLNADTATTVGGSELTVRLVRGPRAPDDERGRAGAREHYAGPLVVEVWRGDDRVARAEWTAPNAPRSTVNRKLYRQRLDAVLEPRDEVRVLPAAGWTETPATFRVADPSPGADHASLLWWFLASVLVNGGVLLGAVALAQRREVSDVPNE